MNINRRTILKGIAAAPVTLAVPAIAAPVTIAAASEVAAVAPVVEKYPWKWWAGYDDVLHEECASREDALEIARECGYPYITEAKHGDFDLRIEYDDLHELWYNRNEERVGEDSEMLEMVTAEQAKDLEARLHATVMQWVADHKIRTQAWMFEAQRNDEYVPCEDGT